MDISLAQYKAALLKSLALLVAVFFIYSYMQSDPFNPSVTEAIFHTVNLVFHEAGHTLLFIFGQFVYVLGGSLFQILLPGLIAFYFYWRQELLSMSIILTWLAASIWEVAIYMKDAQGRVLPLLGDNPDSHDWYYLFSELGVLQKTSQIAGAFETLSYFVLLLAVSIGLYIIWMPIVNNLQKQTSKQD